MVDSYEENPKLLQGQPRRVICEYVGKNGFLTPKSFASEKEANLPEFKKGKFELDNPREGFKFYVEHEKNYQGINLLPIQTLGYCLSFYSEEKIFEQLKSYQYAFKDASNMGFDLEREISFSIWEKKFGDYFSIVADDVVSGKYHIMYFSYENPSGYLMFDESEFLKKDTFFDNEKVPIQFLKKLIHSYESIRSLDNFDNNNCPLMDFLLTDNNEIYFLNYSRGRDFDDSPYFELFDKDFSNWVKVPFVRGKTSSKEEIIKINVFEEGCYKSSKGYLNKNYEFNLGRDIAAKNLDLNIIPLINEGLKFYDSEYSLSLFGSHLAILKGYHHLRAQFFHPKNTILLNPLELLTVNEFKKIPFSFNVQYISNGRKAFIRKI